MTALWGARRGRRRIRGPSTRTRRVCRSRPRRRARQAKPAPVGYTQESRPPASTANRAAVLTDILTKIYGLRADGKDFPTCSAAKIAAPKRHRLPEGRAGRDRLDHVASSAPRTTSRRAGTTATRSARLEQRPGQADVLLRRRSPRSTSAGGLKTGEHRRRIRRPTRPRASTWSSTSRFRRTYVDFPAPGLAGSLTSEHLSGSR